MSRSSAHSRSGLEAGGSFGMLFVSCNCESGEESEGEGRKKREERREMLPRYFVFSFPSAFLRPAPSHSRDASCRTEESVQGLW